MSNIADAISEGFGHELPEETQPPAAPEPVPAPQPAETPPVVAATPEANAAEPAPATGAANGSAQPTVPLGYVPIDALLDIREKWQSEKKARETREERDRQQHAQSQAPSIQDDPEAYSQYLQRQQQEALLAIRFDVSEGLVRDRYGDAEVDAAKNWGMERATASPAFAYEYSRQANPLDWVVKQKRFDEAYKKIGTDPDAYVRQRAAELGFVATAPQATGQAPPVPPQPASLNQPQVPRSIANAPNAGSLAVVPVDENSAFKEVFSAERARRGSG